MPQILSHWNKEGIKFDAFYTGYVSKSQIPYILDIMEQTASENALRIVDPVMADHGKMYPGFDEDFPTILWLFTGLNRFFSVENLL